MSFGGCGPCNGSKVAIAAAFGGRRGGSDDSRGARRLILL